MSDPNTGTNCITNPPIVISNKLQREINSINERITHLLISESHFLETIDAHGYRPAISEPNITHGKIGTLVASISFLLEKSCSISAEEFAQFFTIIKQKFEQVKDKSIQRQDYVDKHPQ